MDREASKQPNRASAASSAGQRSLETCQPACPVCQGSLMEIRGKLQCSRCHTICETCCEGGRG
ncbi:MAG: hypothetical protein GY888_23430 [Planctomycetaceae bacterium]|nr:hypothetical protein [Planctomycetaceae bacterium]